MQITSDLKQSNNFLKLTSSILLQLISLQSNLFQNNYQELPTNIFVSGMQEMKENYVPLAHEMKRFIYEWHADLQDSESLQERKQIWVDEYGYSMTEQQFERKLDSKGENTGHLIEGYFKEQANPVSIHHIQLNPKLTTQSSITACSTVESHDFHPSFILFSHASIATASYVLLKELSQSLAPQNQPFKIITTNQIYSHLIALREFICKIMKEYAQFLNIPLIKVDKFQQRQHFKCLLVKADEYYEYGEAIFKFGKKYWHLESYDVEITVKDEVIRVKDEVIRVKDEVSRSSVCKILVEGPTVSDIKYIYYAWKKGIISEQKYHSYVREWPAQKRIHFNSENKIMKDESSCFHHLKKNPFQGGQSSGKKKQLQDYYLEFQNCQTIKQLSAQGHTALIQEIFNSCDLLSYTQHQVIAKQAQTFHFIFFVVEESPPQTAHSSILWKQCGIQQLIHNQPVYLQTMTANTSTTVLRLRKEQFKFLTGQSHIGFPSEVSTQIVSDI